MNRFVAFLWDDRVDARTRAVSVWSDALRARSPRWTAVVDIPGLCVMAIAQSGREPIALSTPSEAAVIVGRIYERGQEGRGQLKQISQDLLQHCVASHGQELIARHWGSYVALWRTSDRSVQVLRDPCGELPCFGTEAHGIDILCSHVDDIASLDGLHLSIDWNAITAFLADSYLVTRRTGLNELEELLPGERMSWRPDGRRELAWCWNAAELASHPERQSVDAAREELRSTAEACFKGLGSSYRNIIVRVSGGLDSSIAAALLRKCSSANVMGLHLLGRGYEAYEYKLAKLAATHAGIELIEMREDFASASLADIGAGPRLARPTGQILGAHAEAALYAVCAERDADCVMGGHGGDGLFLQTGLAAQVLNDYVRLNGIGRDFWRTAYDTAALLQWPIWDVLKGVFSPHKRDRPSPRAPDDSVLTRSPEFAHAVNSLDESYFAYPLASDIDQLPSCKAAQVRSIIALRNYHIVGRRDVERDAVHPFVSQPLVEFSLRTPAYLFTRGGIDRALERRAFAGNIPEAVMRRTEKGFVNHQLIALLAANVAIVRDLLLNGEVCQHVGLARGFVEQMLTEESLMQGEAVVPIMNLIVAEAWLVPWRAL